MLDFFLFISKEFWFIFKTITITVGPIGFEILRHRTLHNDMSQLLPM